MIYRVNDDIEFNKCIEVSQINLNLREFDGFVVQTANEFE